MGASGTKDTRNDFPITRKPVAGPVVTKTIPTSGIARKKVAM